MPYIRMPNGEPRFIGQGEFTMRVDRMETMDQRVEARRYSEQIRLRVNDRARNHAAERALQRAARPEATRVGQRIVAVKPEQEEVKVEPLKYPLVSETNADGGVKLYKTRYNELERMYGRLYDEKADLDQKRRSLNDLANRYYLQLTEAQQQLHTLTQTVVDSEVVVKRMNQVAKELGIHLNPNHHTMQDKLDSFFASILTRIRCDEVQDELAD